MAKDDVVEGAMMSVAETVGHTLGSIAGQVEAIRTEHPHPVDEARDLIADSGARAAEAGRAAKARVTAVVARATKAIASAKRSGSKVVQKATRAAASARKRAVTPAKKKNTKKVMPIRKRAAVRKAVKKSVKKAPKKKSTNKKKAAPPAKRRKAIKRRR